MCTNAVKTAASLLEAIEPTIVSLLTETKLINTPEAQTLMTEYQNVLTAIQNWTPGTPAQEALELLGIFQTAVNALPIPSEYLTLFNIILAGIETVIGVLTANSPAPAPAVATFAAPEEAQALHQANVIAATAAKIQALVPSFTRSIWHTAAAQYKNAWNSAVDHGNFPDTLAV